MEAAKKFAEFNIIDPREGQNGNKYQFKTQAEAEAKAVEIGSSKFGATREDGSQVAFEQKDGKWLEQTPQQAGTKAEPPTLDVPEQFATKSPNAVTVLTFKEDIQDRNHGKATEQPTQSPRPDFPTPLPDRQGGNQVQLEDAGSALEAKRSATPYDITTRYDGNGTTFTQKGNQQERYKDAGDRLETESNSEGTARDLIDIADTRGWHEIRVTGSESFRKEAWREAASRGMEIKGYSPTEEDKKNAAERAGSMAKEVIAPENRAKEQKEQEAGKGRAEAFLNMKPGEAVEKHPELAGSYAAMSAIQRKAQEDKLTPEQQEVVSNKVKQNIASALGKGQVPAVQLREQAQHMNHQRTNEPELER